MENEGVFKNPIANATPDGIHFENHRFLLTAWIFKADINPNTIEKAAMNMALFSGNWPSPNDNTIHQLFLEHITLTLVRTKKPCQA